MSTVPFNAKTPKAPKAPNAPKTPKTPKVPKPPRTNEQDLENAEEDRASSRYLIVKDYIAEETRGYGGYGLLPLEALVDDYIKDGWKVKGGMIPDRHGMYGYQTLTREISQLDADEDPSGAGGTQWLENMRAATAAGGAASGGAGGKANERKRSRKQNRGTRRRKN